MTATCIGCGCDDLNACEGGCHWLRVDYIRCVGVCSACQPYAAAWDAAHAFGPPHLDLVAHLHRQRMFSLRTFGPGERPGMNVAHIRKELIEIERNPRDMEEWVDVALLAFDGALRAGHEPASVALELATKLTTNELRQWPDWRTAAPGAPIEHVRAPSDMAASTLISDTSRTYLLIGGGDGYETHVVAGDKLEDAYLALHFGAAENCPADKRDDFLEALRDEDRWSHNYPFGPTSYHEDLEDGFVGVVLMTSVCRAQEPAA